MLVAWPEGKEAWSGSKEKSWKSKGPSVSNSLGRARPRIYLVRLPMRPVPSHAHEHEADGAGDQPVAGGIAEALMRAAEHKRKRHQGARRDQHPVRPADVGDAAEEVAGLGCQRLRPLQEEGSST